MTVRPIGQPDRSRFTGPELEAYDWVVQRERNRGMATDDGVISPYFGTMLHSPEVCYHVSSLGRLFRLVGDRDDSFSHLDREWTDQVLSIHMSSNVVMRGHLEDALARGVGIEDIKALWEGREEDLPDHEKLLADYVRQVYDGTVRDDTVVAMKDAMGERGVVEFTVWIEFLAFTIRLIEALMPVSGVPTTEELLVEINEYADGTRPVPAKVAIEAG